MRISCNKKQGAFGRVRASIGAKDAWGRVVRKGRWLACVVVLGATIPAEAEDKRSMPFSWTGLYLGGHAGYSRGNAGATFFAPAAAPASHNYGTMIAGAHGGYNYVLPNRVLLGIEIDG